MPHPFAGEEERRIYRGMNSWPSLASVLALRAVLRPSVALDLISLAWSMRRRGWLRALPFLPLPPRDYLRWRMYTAYGDENAVPPADDVLRYAKWRRRLMTS
jgi:hypothetical protein